MFYACQDNYLYAKEKSWPVRLVRKAPRFSPSDILIFRLILLSPPKFVEQQDRRLSIWPYHDMKRNEHKFYQDLWLPNVPMWFYVNEDQTKSNTILCN